MMRIPSFHPWHPGILAWILLMPIYHPYSQVLSQGPRRIDWGVGSLVAARAIYIYSPLQGGFRRDKQSPPKKSTGSRLDEYAEPWSEWPSG